MPDFGDTGLTELLNRFSAGDPQAESELVPLIYGELRKMAMFHLRRERAGHTLQPTALVHEAYLRIAGRQTCWAGREHFFAVAARIMRGILTDYARQRSAQKRGAGAFQVEFPDDGPGIAYDFDMVLHVDSALEKLAEFDVRQARIVEMRYFAGMTEEEIGLLLGVSTRTIKRDWTMAKAWLASALSGAPTDRHTDSR